MMDERWPDEFWGNDPVSGGGNVLSQGCHTVDLCSYLLRSEPVEVYAAGGNFHHPGLAIVDQALMILRFANGSLASIVQGDLGATPFVSKMSFQIMDGVRTAHLHDRLKKAVMWDGSSLQTHSDAEEYGVAHENHEFVESLRSGRRPSSTLHDGVRATVVLLRALDSLRTGKPEAIFW
jgi:predicted dehydrogenase